jgi:hypothetical protein
LFSVYTFHTFSSSQGVDALASVLSFNQSLTSIDLDQNQLGTRGAILMLEVSYCDHEIFHVLYARLLVLRAF